MWMVGMGILIAFVALLLFGVFIGKVIHHGLDGDAPAHVSVGDWDRVTRARNAEIRRH